ncbi:hypothetical protein [Hydrogenophaga palleronii]|uniref:hypothetical protein n=1 Tax=Hydrogenophaga palleronii TaxID=65655 RepID=UPI00286D525A|nr:hypothetical protein [Hydrogenophaga palleronii]
MSLKRPSDQVFDEAEVEQRLSNLKAAIFGTLQSQEHVEDVVVRYCRRRIDRALKRLDLSAPKNVASLVFEYTTQTAQLDVANIAAEATSKIRDASTNGDLPDLLTIYDNKGLLALAASHLKQTRVVAFEAWLTRMLRDEVRAPNLAAALKAVLPRVHVI